MCRRRQAQYEVEESKTPASSRSFSKPSRIRVISDVSTTNTAYENQLFDLIPKLNFSEFQTVNVLSEMGEINNFRQGTISTETQKQNMMQHGDILAGLENPKGLSEIPECPPVIRAPYMPRK